MIVLLGEEDKLVNPFIMVPTLLVVRKIADFFITLVVARERSRGSIVTEDEFDILEEEQGLEIPRGKYATVAGFLLERAKDVPEQGDVIVWKGITFTIHKALPQVIQEVRIQW